jgi:GTPase SAR1 family protein
VSDVADQSTIEQLVNKLDEAAALLAPLSEGRRWQESLADLRQQLLTRQRIVAVFGAFSAGKSSLINAIIGQPALVVSPNPTTAAITHVYGADGDAPAARVTAKTADQLEADVRQAWRALHLPEEDRLEALVERAAGLKPTDFTPAHRRFVAFLKAVAAGWPDMKDRLGTAWDAGADDLAKCTADERYACFVHRVDLFVLSERLKSTGMVLVDTPGVDSIHRRHTDVAFQYMQNADAVLFVLYYTHAFSRADREFLRQLADVQDIVGTNKLFVVINAVDLAESEEERQAVRQRVVSELRQAGIREPRVYEVSSQLAFAAEAARIHPEDPRYAALIRAKLGIPEDRPLDLAKIRDETGVPRLAADVLSFLEEQAVRLAADAVERRLSAIAEDVARGAELRRLQAEQDAAAKAEKQRQAAEFVKMLAGISKGLQDGTEPRLKSLYGEWDELLFHIGERARHRFPQWFKECFHPGRFRVPSQDVHNLKDAAAELADVLGRDVEAEMRTFALRAHRQVRATLESIRQEWGHMLMERGLLHVQVPHVSETPAEVAELPERVIIDGEVFRPVFRHFKSARHFFEGGGQQAMQAAAEPVAMDHVRSAVDRLAEPVKTAAVSCLTNVLQDWIRELSTALMADPWAAEGGQDDLPAWVRAETWFREHGYVGK